MQHKTYRLALLGNNIEKSVSPRIYTDFFEQLGLKHTYTKLSSFQNGYDWINITTPYKKKLLLKCNDLTFIAKQLKNINLICEKDGILKGHNTDYGGLKKAFETQKITPEKRSVLVLGGGGAAHTVVHLCQDLGAKKITVCNRTYEHIQDLFKLATLKDFSVLSNDLCQHDFVINALPITLRDLQEQDFSKNQVLYDLRYLKSDLGWLLKNRNKVLGVYSGFVMLLYQAALSVDFNLGLMPNIEATKTQLLREQEQWDLCDF